MPKMASSPSRSPFPSPSAAPPPPPPPPPPRSRPGSSSAPISPNRPGEQHLDSDLTTRRFFAHSSAQRLASDCVVFETLRYQYPQLEVVITPEYSSNLFGFAAAGHAKFDIIEGGPPTRYPESLKWTSYAPPARRLDGATGGLVQSIHWAKIAYEWNDEKFIVYFAEGKDGPYGVTRNFYILTTTRAKAEQLVLAAGKWSNELHDEVWVFDGGWWDKSRELYESVKKASWENVILDEDMKEAIIDDHMTFFRSRESYSKLKVPWKRGVIYYGPPGNGKTISIKAMMNMLMKEDDPIPTLYVRSLVSYMGPEAAIQSIFGKARQLAPCYLVLEDIDTIISDNVRSYFLNEVDGLKSNDGIFMIGSTNHLDRLDPGIAKRPSRFDRKYLFPDPDVDQRVAYCHFWQEKLADNEEIEFPDRLCKAIADITGGFSFAYMQEAFVAALLAIARRSTDSDAKSFDGVTTETVDEDWISVLSSSDDDLEKVVLWVEIKKQIKILREGMEKNR